MSCVEDVIVDDLCGKMCVVIGLMSGIGVIIVCVFVKCGVCVVLVCCIFLKVEVLVECWMKEVVVVGTVLLDCAVMALDLDSFASVEAFAKAF